MSYEAINKALDGLENRLCKNVEALGLQQREISERLLMLEQKGAPGGGMEALNHGVRSGQTIGQQFAAKMSANAELFAKTGRLAVPVETKGLITSAQVGSRNSMGATAGPEYRPDTEVAALLDHKPFTGIQSLTYVRRSHALPEGAGASVQAGEGGLKTESTPVYSSVTQNQITIAAYANVTTQAVNDSSELAAAIDLHLQRDIYMKLSAVLMGGSTATGMTFEGLLALVPTPYQTILLPGTPSLEQKIAALAMNIRALGYGADMVVVNPADWEDVVTRVGSDGHYVNGSPFGMPAFKIAGMSVAFSPFVDTGKFMLVDTRYVGYLISSVMTIEVGHVNDQFIRNISTVRAEMSVIPYVRDARAIRRLA